MEHAHVQLVKCSLKMGNVLLVLLMGVKLVPLLMYVRSVRLHLNYLWIELSANALKAKEKLVLEVAVHARLIIAEIVYMLLPKNAINAKATIL